MKWLAIINPRANHHTPQHLEYLAGELEHWLGADCVWTTYPRQALDLTVRNPGYNGFIAVGGDGTIAEVVNGLRCEKHCLGIIPAGTGNGLARDLQLEDEATAVRALRQPRFGWLYLISVRYRARQTWHQRRMISTSAVGYVAGATRLSNHPAKHLGAWYYLVAAFLQCWQQGTFRARIRRDGGLWQNHQLTNLVVHNTQFIGQFRLFPEARPHDGQLNLLLGNLPPVAQLTEDLGILTRTYFFHRSAHYQAQHLEIELDPPGTLMVDGDLMADVDTIQYQMDPNRLECCIGLNSAGKRSPCGAKPPGDRA